MGDIPQVSVRGLTDSEFGTPLREFTGILDNFYPEETQWGTRIQLGFKDLADVVCKEGEAYQYPIAQIGIKYSNRKRSSWGVLSDSLVKVIPETEDIKDQLGKRIRMKLTPGHNFGKNRTTGEEMIADCWEVVEVVGAGGGVDAVQGGSISAKDRAMELLNGKSLPEFNQVAFTDSAIRRDPDLIASINDRSFIAALKSAGLFTEDAEGIYHKV